MGKTITELIQAFTERGIARRTWNGSTSIVDQNVSVDNVLSNPHHNNGVSKVLGILLSDFVSHGSEHSLWRHHGHENKQFQLAQCQRKASALSGRHNCVVWHSAGISGKCRDIGIDLVGSPPGRQSIKWKTKFKIFYSWKYFWKCFEAPLIQKYLVGPPTIGSCIRSPFSQSPCVMSVCLCHPFNYCIRDSLACLIQNRPKPNISFHLISQQNGNLFVHTSMR